MTTTLVVINTISTILIACFTVALARSTRRLWEETRDAARRVISSERAWLVPGCHFRGGPDGNPKRPIIMSIKNSGRTVGFLKRIRWGVCSESEFSDELKHNAPQELRREDILPPQMSEIPVRPVTIEVAGNEGKIFFGRVDYEDVFGVQRFNTWKHRIGDNGSTTPLDGAYSDYS